MEKKKMDPLTKVKLMLLVEYLIFVALFCVLGILFLTNIIKVADWKRYVFTYLTLAGAIWVIADFVWALTSKKRRAKSCLLDKCLLLPLGPFLLVFDLIAAAKGCPADFPYRYVIGSNFLYLGAIYLFQSIYHWYRPIPAVIEAALEEEQTKRAESSPRPVEKNDKE